MDLRQIEAFVQVAQHRSFSKAAEALYLTQPSVTARIQALERDLGEPLFERNGRGVRLTEVGASFLPYARRALKALQDGRDVIDGLRHLETGSLRLGSAVTVSTYVLPGILKKFVALYPGIDVTVNTARSEQVLGMLLNDEVQAAMVRTLHHPEVVTVPLYEDEVVLIVAPGHPFAGREAVDMREVSQEPLILFDRGSSYNALIHSAFRQAGVVPRTVMDLDSMEATKKMVEEGLGIAMIPRVAVERELELGYLRAVEVRGGRIPNRQISLLFRRNRRLPRAVRAFFDLIEELYGVRVEGPEDASAAK